MRFRNELARGFLDSRRTLLDDCFWWDWSAGHDTIWGSVERLPARKPDLQRLMNFLFKNNMLITNNTASSETSE